MFSLCIIVYMYLLLREGQMADRFPVASVVDESQCIFVFLLYCVCAFTYKVYIYIHNADM